MSHITLGCVILTRNCNRVTDYKRILSNGREGDVLAASEVVISSPLMQPCTACLGASCGNALRYLVTSEWYKSYAENLIFSPR